MGKTTDFGAIFERLKAILAVHAPGLVVKADTADTYYLDTAIIQKNKTPLFFGAVQIKKNYVSYHLFPVYVYPELLGGISPDLRRRMQGKSCFNFVSLDEPLFGELAQLTAVGAERFAAQGFLKA
ncbi:MAG TPA: hypothetical protein VD969_03375 [Symbiobacteriaceae bacterium]|nr:hypothetical protein [Symbiobacteriaceae bacterium]